MRIFNVLLSVIFIFAGMSCEKDSNSSASEDGGSTAPVSTGGIYESSVEGTITVETIESARATIDQNSVKSSAVTFETETVPFEMCLLSDSIEDTNNVYVLLFLNFGEDNEVVYKIENGLITFTESGGTHKMCFDTYESNATYLVIESTEEIPEAIPYTATQPLSLASAELRVRILTLTFSEPLDESSVPAAGDFTLKGDISGDTIESVSVSGNQVILLLETGAGEGATVSFDYTPGANPLRKANGLAIDTIASQAISHYDFNWDFPATMADSFTDQYNDQNNYWDIDMAASGETVIFWNSTGGPANNRNLLLEYSNGAWNNPTIDDFVALDNANGFGIKMKAAFSKNGNLILCWQHSDGSDLQTFVATRINNNWTYPADNSDFLSWPGQAVGDIECAINDNGFAVVTWIESDGSNQAVFVAELVNGSWSKPSGISDNISPDGANASYPIVVVDNSNQAIVVWTQANVIYKADYRSSSWSFTNTLG